LFAEKRLIGACRYNSAWLLHAYGSEVHHDLAIRPILCSGTTLGQAAAVKAYLDLLLCEVKGLRQNKIEIVTGLDQGIHNYLYYSNKLAGTCAVLNNEDGPVNTMGYAEKRLNAGGLIVNEKNEVSYLAHQLNRMNVEDLKRYEQSCAWPCQDMYEQRGKISPGDLVEIQLEWPVDAACRAYHLQQIGLRVGAKDPIPGLSQKLTTLYDGDCFNVGLRTPKGDNIAAQAKVRRKPSAL
jgi:hypothetical protein